MSAHPPDRTRPLFLVGMPRSGTKLLRDLLNRHPDIGIPEVETEFLPMWAKQWDEYGDLSHRARFLEFHRRMSRLPFFVYSSERGEPIDAQRWRAGCRTFACGDVFEGLIRSVVGADVPIWGDKSPSYLGHVPLLKRLFPDARVVHIVRDVRDYALSIHRAWGKSMYRAAERWSRDVDRGVRAVHDLGGDGLLVRYERLVSDTEGTMRELCRFLGIDYTTGMTSLEKPAENLGLARGTTAILHGNTGNYAEVMSPRRQKRIEEIAFDTMVLLGYRPELARAARPLPASAMAVLKLTDGFAVVRAAARERGWLGAATFHLHFQKYRISGRAG